MRAGDQLVGVWVAMVTPWDEVRSAPRKDALARLVSRYAEAGVDGLFILGTTGEGTLLTPEERKVFAEETVDVAKGRLPVIVHTGHDRTSVAVELAVHAQAAGAVAVAVSAPARYRLDDGELEVHFLQVAQALGDFPMLLYDIPCSTGNALSAELLIRVSEQAPNVVGAKVSRSDWQAWEGYLALAESKALFVGTDTMCLPALLLGASGIVSGPANLSSQCVLLRRAVGDEHRELVSKARKPIAVTCRACHHTALLVFIRQEVAFLGCETGSRLVALRSLTLELAELQTDLTQLQDRVRELEASREGGWLMNG